MTSLPVRVAVLAVLGVLLGGAGASAQTPRPTPAPARPAAAPADNSLAALRIRANAGDADAQFDLGWRYTTGEGVPKDYVEAHKWRNLAAAHASAENQKPWADARDRLEKMMAPQQLADAQKRASEWQAAFEQRKKP